MSRLLFGLVALLGMTGGAADAHLLTTGAGGTAGGSGPPTITGLSLSNASFPAGAPSGTLVGTVTVQMTGGSFGGSLSLSGADAASFQIVGSNLATSGVDAARTYNIGLTATQAGAVGSPFGPVAVTVTGISSMWNPLDNSDLILTNNNLTASEASTAAWRSVRLTTSRSSGKYYFEVTAVAMGYGTAGYIIGLGTASATLTSYAGSDVNAYGFQCAGNAQASIDYFNSVFFESNKWDYCTAGNVVGYAVDLAAKKVWIKNLTKGTGWNYGSAGTQDPASGQGGIGIANISGNIFPMFSGWLGSQAGTATVNTGISPFTGTVPGGFTAWN